MLILRVPFIVIFLFISVQLAGCVCYGRFRDSLLPR
jgi:hypothetical protein